MNSYLHVLNRLCEEVQRTMADKSKDEIEWTVEVEILLFYSMIGLKPVGVNRHFMMACIHNRFSNFLNRQITSKPIWDHLDSMYDMAALHESEIIPFPNEEKEYELPDDEFGDMMRERMGQPVKTETDAEAKKEEATKAGKKIFAKPRPVQSPKEGKESSASKSPAGRFPLSVKAEAVASTSNVSSEATKLKPKPDTPQSKTVKTKAPPSVTPMKTPKTEASASSQVKAHASGDVTLQKAKTQVVAVKKPLKQEKERHDSTDSKKGRDSPATDRRKSVTAKEMPSSSRRKDSVSKKSSEGQSPKPGKSDRSPAGTPTKSVKFEKEDSESSIKSRSQTKSEIAADKKTRRTKAEESPAKKTMQVQKRRRVN